MPQITYVCMQMEEQHCDVLSRLVDPVVLEPGHTGELISEYDMIASNFDDPHIESENIKALGNRHGIPPLGVDACFSGAFTLLPAESPFNFPRSVSAGAGGGGAGAATVGENQKTG
jgi:hypothetical protein